MTTEVDAAKTPRQRPGRRRWVWWIITVVVLTVGVALLGSALAMDTSTAPGHPDNPGADGTRAVDRVLERQGVRTEIVTTRAELRRSRPDVNSTVVIPRMSFGPGALADVTPELQRAGRVVLLGPNKAELDEADLPVEPAATQLEDATPCAMDLLPEPTPQADPWVWTPYTAPPSWQACYGTTTKAGIVAGPWGAGEVVVVGSTSPPTNVGVLRADNAQLVLWLLGSKERLIWYLPDPNDIPKDADDEEPPDPVPAWARYSLGLLSGAVVVLMVARGRRFGPLAREPLPVIVPAIETTLARGRLYRRHGSIEHSADRLRAAATRRLARRMGLPPASAPAVVADRLRVEHPQAVELLTGDLPHDQRTALSWADRLNDLEREVSRR